MDDIKRIFRPSDLLLAMALLTRLPVSLPLQAGRAPGAAAWAYPLVGLVVAGVALAPSVAQLGEFKADEINLTDVAKNIPVAQKIFNAVGWK